jgi:transposase
MATALQLALSETQISELTWARDHHPKPHLRERAAAILKVAAGQSALQVAKTGLLKPRHPETVRIWCHNYRTHGLAGLDIQAGRGRKPAFSPSLS